MKSNKVLAGMMLIGGLFTINAQTQTTTLTSLGLETGTAGSNNAFFGYRAGKAGSSYSTYVGQQAGLNATGGYNAFVGNNSGGTTTTGARNVFVGFEAGLYNQTGNENVSLGYRAGSNMLGSPFGSFTGNVHVGSSSGQQGTGSYNTFLGNKSGWTSTGDYNVHVGAYSGYSADGQFNVFLGQSAGYNAQGDNKLYIENSNNITTPLIWGDFANDLVKLNAKVGIGGVTTFPSTAGGANLTNYNLFVNGGILATEVRVSTTWADYVFGDSYALPTLNEVECFIGENGHLPNVPSAKQVAEEGISVGEMAKIQQEKIEELTLYAIGQDKQLKNQEALIAIQGQQLNEQKREIEELKAQMQILMAKK